MADKRKSRAADDINPVQHDPGQGPSLGADMERAPVRGSAQRSRDGGHHRWPAKCRGPIQASLGARRRKQSECRRNSQVPRAASSDEPARSQQREKASRMLATHDRLKAHRLPRAARATRPHDGCVAWGDGCGMARRGAPEVRPHRNAALGLSGAATGATHLVSTGRWANTARGARRRPA